MYSALISIVKWSTIPALLVASPFSGLAAGYEPLINVLVCMAAVVLLQRAVWMRQYVSGGGFIVVGVVFSPIALIVKIFLLLLLTCIVTFAVLLAAFRVRPLPAVCVTP
jgi:hypothetical protein